MFPFLIRRWLPSILCLGVAMPLGAVPDDLVVHFTGIEIFECGTGDSKLGVDVLRSDGHLATLMFPGTADTVRPDCVQKQKTNDPNVIWTVCPLHGFETLSINSGAASKKLKIWNPDHYIPIAKIFKNPGNNRTDKTIA